MSTAAGNHYITKRKSRSGSIPYGNLPLTLDISFQVKCYQSLTPIQTICFSLKLPLAMPCAICYNDLLAVSRIESGSQGIFIYI